MSNKCWVLMLVLANLSFCLLVLVKGGNQADSRGNSNSISENSRRDDYISIVRGREVRKMHILSQLFVRIKNYSNQTFSNLTEVETKAIGRRTAACLDKKPNRRSSHGRNKESNLRDRCIVVPPLCLNNSEMSMKNQSVSDSSFVFNVNSLYKKGNDMSLLKVISMSLNLKLLKKGVKIAQRSDIYLKIYGAVNKLSGSDRVHTQPGSSKPYLIKTLKVVPGKNRWIKVQLGREFAKFRHNAKGASSGLKPFGITLLLEDGKGVYHSPEYLFHAHRCAKPKKANSSFSMPHLMVAQKVTMKTNFVLTGMRVVQVNARS